MDYTECFIFLYTCTYYCDEDGHEKEECGMIYAEDYKDVFNQIAVLYGDDLVNISIKSKDNYSPMRFDPKHLSYIEALIEENNY